MGNLGLMLLTKTLVNEGSTRTICQHASLIVCYEGKLIFFFPLFFSTAKSFYCTVDQAAQQYYRGCVDSYL